ncbi:Chitin deacetylase-like protein 9 [Stagonosporopsis vannaccii]|nr:Chitin deacetylase-like protein 9 [Stagonosporopsis vannaccii]
MHSAVLLAVAALPFLGVEATYKANINLTARCGAQSRNGATCKNSVFGNCCSKSGFCGRTSSFCGTGCQVGFGDCTTKKPFSTSTKLSTSTRLSTSVVTSVVVSVTPTAASSTPSAPSTTPDVTVTPTPTPEPSPSSSTPSSAPAASSSSTPDVKISTDGSCGGTSGFTCSGSAFGDCCSEYGWCGSTSIYCDAGCNPAFGTCGGVSSAPVEPSSTPGPEPTTSTLEPPSSFTTLTRTSSATPSPTGAVSTTGQCGGDSGLTCLGSEFGDCCSQYGYCGGETAFCGTGCNPLFGSCTPTPAPGPICGVEGFAAKEAYYASSFNLVPATDVSTCATLCLGEPQCKSYLFNPGLGNCAYLAWTLAEGDFIASATNQLFWDRACAETAAA